MEIAFFSCPVQKLSGNEGPNTETIVPYLDQYRGTRNNKTEFTSSNYSKTNCGVLKENGPIKRCVLAGESVSLWGWGLRSPLLKLHPARQFTSCSLWVKMRDSQLLLHVMSACMLPCFLPR